MWLGLATQAYAILCRLLDSQPFRMRKTITLRNKADIGFAQMADCEVANNRNHLVDWQI